MPKRYQSVLVVGEMLSGKSYWVSTHLKELRTKWFDVEHVTVCDGLQSKELGDLTALNDNDLIIFDHIITDAQWNELSEALPIFAERGVATMIITQPGIGDIAHMGKLFDTADQWVFFHHERATSKMYKDENLRKVCALQKEFIDSLSGLAVGEYRFVRRERKIRDSRP